ncbi:TSUP family transporter [Haladaptatus sp. AB643]|uniref:sulfite exporter TauE/SafE family protein n=1 Tax=unclassified Haladaptatus TaxID=2622732 RepID=UPI00209C6CA2|nr:sulfite exporter TauE/SafE family protein [Haladaptatus sp. AB643]MCO8255431.1 sulfite exporter TauE/SafE family protein [Haladaptatus sp. AB618]
MDPLIIAVFIGFGLIIGILFGFFGMGGSFLVTPALLVFGYPAKVAVGSGLAFVFGTSVIAALRHRNLGQVDYKLALMFIVGMTTGIKVGEQVVLWLEATGIADAVVGIAYVFLLAAVGLFTLRDARGGGGDSSLPDRFDVLQIPPMVSISGGVEISIWLTLGIALFVGILSGFLGVGGGFLLMPAMVYVLGVPAVVAVGTDVLQITISGGFGAFSYAQNGAVELAVVVPLLAGSALGARIGAAATSLTDEDDIKGYFAAMLLAGSVAVASNRIGDVLGIQILDKVSLVLIFGSALLVAAAVVYSALVSLRNRKSQTVVTAE